MKDEIEYRNEKWKDYGIDYAKEHEKEKPEDCLEFKNIFKLYKPHPSDKVLEIGCNTGEFCYLLKKKYDVIPIGIDINSSAISIAKEKYPDIDFQVKDIVDLDGEYDTIYLLHVIEHLEDPKKALVKLKSMLTEAGELIVTCPNGWAYPSKIICWIRGKKFCYDPTHLYEFNPISLSKLLTNSGYSTNKIITSPRGIPYLHRISTTVYYSIPSFLFGDHIFCLARKK